MKDLFRKLPKNLRIFIIFVLFIASVSALLTVPLWISVKVLMMGICIVGFILILIIIWFTAKNIVENMDKKSETKG